MPVERKREPSRRTYILYRTIESNLDGEWVGESGPFRLNRRGQRAVLLSLFMSALSMTACLGLECAPTGGRPRRALLAGFALVLIGAPSMGVPHLHLSLGDQARGSSASVAVAHAHATTGAHQHETPENEEARDSSSFVVLWSAAGEAVVPVGTASGLAGAEHASLPIAVAVAVEGETLRPRGGADPRESRPYSLSLMAAPISRRGPPASSV